MGKSFRVKQGEAGSAQAERVAFSLRLRQALEDAGYHELRVSDMVGHFNARASMPVSGHAVRKWLLAEAIPKQARLEILADWLACDLAWLRFGTDAAPGGAAPEVDKADLALLRDLSRLDRDTKDLIAAMLVILRKAGETWRD